MLNPRARIIVTGLVGLYPLGGVAYDYFQYFLGLSRLGHDVYYHEDSWSWPYNPVERQTSSDGTYSANFISDYINAHAPSLREKWHYLHLHETSFGMSRNHFDQVASTADLFFNISGACQIPQSLSSQCVKVFLDTDPGYNQIMLKEKFWWSSNVDRWCDSVWAHDQFFTYAENMYGSDCLIPRLGIPWKTTRTSVIRDLWQSLIPASPQNTSAWTTVMTWNGFKGRLLYDGVEYKSKDGEFEKIITLPEDSSVAFKIAVGGKAPTKQLSAYGWEIVDAPQETLTTQSYQAFIAQSKGEFSIAKHVYVALRSGWFSSRSACYLASGRPVVVQDTGFSHTVPVGAGLLTFQSREEAIDAIREVEGNYEWHCKAARELSEDCFDSDTILRQFIEDVFAARDPMEKGYGQAPT
ncbi:MAG: glycosyltransferase family 1 protein [Nitrospirales bacterium]